MRKSFALVNQSAAIGKLLSAFVLLGLVLSAIGLLGIHWVGAQSQVPNYIFPNEVPAHGELGGGTANIVTDSSGVRGDLVVRNYTDVWLTLSVTASGGATVSSDDVFVGFGILPPSGTVTYHGSYTQVGQNISILARYDFNAWLWNTADTILGLIPGGDALNPSALGQTLLAIKGLNSVQKAAVELQAIKTDGWLSVPGHVWAAANELRKLATDDQQAAALQATLAAVGINVSQGMLRDLLVLWSIYDELKHIAHTLVFLIVAPDGASVVFEAQYHGAPPPPVPPPTPPTPTPRPTTDSATFVLDVTIPDGTVVSPGQSLHKVWRMQNSGTSTWGAGYEWVFISGEQMGAPSSVSVPSTSPGNAADIAVDMVAPNDPGAHCGTWRMRNPDRVFFGDQAWICVHVETPGGGHITQFTFDPPSPSSASMVRIYAKVENYPDLRAMRILVDGSVICELGAPEIYCDWNTGSYAAGDHSVVVEVADWSDLNWVHPERRGAVYTLSGTPGNHRPNKPRNSSPYDWYVTIGSPPQLCGEHQGDPDGDAIASYQFHAEASVGTYDSPWVSGNCHTPSSLNPGTYSWKMRVKDSRGGVSDWSDPWHFSVEAAGVTINELYFEPLDANQEQVRIRACTEGHAGVNITLRVLVNDANDGSDSGEWHIIKELGVPCFNEQDAPVWHTLPYEDGTHRVRVVANAIQPDATDTRDELYTLLHRRPASPELLSPVDRHDVNRIVWLNTRSVTFSWAPTVRAQGYTLHVSTTSNPSGDPSPILRQSVGTNTSYSTTFTDDYPDLYWQVTATNDVGSNDSGAGHIGIDRVPPETAVDALPAAWYDTQFVVRWGGSDDRSGIARYDIQFRDGPRGEWVDWLVDTELTQSIFSGEAGHHYCFRSRGRDNAGNQEVYPSGDGDSCTLIDLNAMPPTPWWNDNYSFKRNLVILNQDNQTLPSGYPVVLKFDNATSPTAAQLYAVSQSAAKGDDFRITYNDDLELARYVRKFGATLIEIYFRTQQAIAPLDDDATSYQLYYGNSGATNPPGNIGSVFYPPIDAHTRALLYFQEAAGHTAYDTSSYHNNGSIGADVVWTDGKWGSALRFPGTDGQCVNLGAPSSLNLGTITVEGWVQNDEPTWYDRFFSQLGGGGNVGENKWVLRHMDRKLEVLVWPAGQGSQTVSTNDFLDTTDRNWHHYAFTFDGANTVRIYYDGVLKKWGTVNGPWASTNTTVEIGCGEHIRRLKGRIQNVRISDVVRSDFSYGAFAAITSEPTSAAGSEISQQPAPPPTDLVIGNVVAYPADAEGQLIVQAVLDNGGDASTINGFWTDLYADHEPTGPGDYTGSVNQWVASPIEAGSTITLTTVLTDTSNLGISSNFGVSGIEEITKTLYLQTDTDGVVNDADRTNNISPGVQVCFASADLFESDDDPASTHLIQGTETHNTHVPGDEDWIKFNAVAGTTYAIQTSNLGIAADTYVYLYDSDGTTLLTANDDYGGTLASRIEWQAPADGTYYVVVKHWNPNVAGCGTTYDLSIGVSEPDLPYKTYFPIIMKGYAAPGSSEPLMAPTPTATPSPTVTPVPTSTPTPSSTATTTPTEVPTPTATEMPTVTPSPTEEPSPTATPTATLVSTPSETRTPTVTVLPTPSPMATMTPSPTPSATPSSTDTATPPPSPTSAAIRISSLSQELAQWLLSMIDRYRLGFIAHY